MLTALAARLVHSFYTILFPHARMHPTQLDEKAGSLGVCSRRPVYPLMTIAAHILQVQPSTGRVTVSMMYWKRRGLDSHRIFPAFRSRARRLPWACSCLLLASVRCSRSAGFHFESYTSSCMDYHIPEPTTLLKQLYDCMG